MIIKIKDILICIFYYNYFVFYKLKQKLFFDFLKVFFNTAHTQIFLCLNSKTFLHIFELLKSNQEYYNYTFQKCVKITHF
jgi:hypothetical protein